MMGNYQIKNITLLLGQPVDHKSISINGNPTELKSGSTYQ